MNATIAKKLLLNDLDTLKSHIAMISEDDELTFSEGSFTKFEHMVDYLKTVVKNDLEIKQDRQTSSNRSYRKPATSERDSTDWLHRVSNSYDSTSCGSSRYTSSCGSSGYNASCGSSFHSGC